MVLFTLLVLFTVTSTTVFAEEISQNQLLNLLKQEHKPLLLDVRSPEEYAQGHIEGAVNIPHSEVNTRLNELLAYKNQQIVLYCRSGRRAELVKTELLKQGFTQLDHLTGDFNEWQASDLPQVGK